MRTIFFFSLILMLSIAMLYVLRPFLYPIFWASVVAIMFYPVYKLFLRYLRLPAVSAGLTLIVVIVTIILPLILVSTLVIHGSIGFYQRVSELSNLRDSGALSSRLEHTMFGPYLGFIKTQLTTYGPNIAKQVNYFLLSSLKDITQNTLRFIFLLFVMFYSLFYFLKDGPRLLRRLMHLSPLGDQYEKMLYGRFTSTARATLKGTLIVGGIQGVLGGLLFWAVGIEGALVWGVIMTSFAIIPAVGPSIIWLPGALVMIALGNVTEGIIILSVGVGVISVIDNILRPRLIGRDIQMHPLIAFFATLGGIILFGISGFVIGPVIAALYLSVMAMYDHYYEHELGKEG